MGSVAPGTGPLRRGDRYGRVVAADGARAGRAGRRAGLVSAVLEAVRTVGPTASMDELADAAQVPKSVVYNHFADRAGLLSAVGDAAADEWCDRLGQASSVGTESQRGRAAIEVFVALAEAEPHLYDLVRPGADRRASSNRVERIGAGIAAAVAPHRPDDDPETAGAVGGAMFAAVDRWSAHGTMDRDDLIDGLLVFVRAGLGPPPDPATA